MTSYIPPHLRNRKSVAPVPVAPTSLDMSKGFPVIGNARVAAIKHSLDLQALKWSENTRETDEERHARLAAESRELGWENLRALYRSRPAPPPYIRNDDRYEAYLAEQDYLDAVKYDEENPLPHAPASSPTGWETNERKVVKAPKQMKMDDDPLIDDEMTEDEMRARCSFLQKRLRRNGILQEDREAYEKELRDLQWMLQESD